MVLQNFTPVLSADGGEGIVVYQLLIHVMFKLCLKHRCFIRMSSRVIRVAEWREEHSQSTITSAIGGSRLAGQPQHRQRVSQLY